MAKVGRRWSSAGAATKNGLLASAAMFEQRKDESVRFEGDLMVNANLERHGEKNRKVMMPTQPHPTKRSY